MYHLCDTWQNVRRCIAMGCISEGFENNMTQTLYTLKITSMYVVKYD